MSRCGLLLRAAPVLPTPHLHTPVTSVRARITVHAEVLELELADNLLKLQSGGSRKRPGHHITAGSVRGERACNTTWELNEQGAQWSTGMVPSGTEGSAPSQLSKFEWSSPITYLNHIEQQLCLGENQRAVTLLNELRLQ